MYLIEMVGKTKLILVVALLFFTGILGQNKDEYIEVDMELDTKEEEKLMNEAGLNDMNNKDDYETLDHSIENEKTENVANDPINEETEDAPVNEPEASQSDNKDITSNDPQELNLENKKEKKDNDSKSLPKPLWKIKDIADETREAGFDLTNEEQKKFKIWKDGSIPYYIDVVSFSDKVLRDKIRNYLQVVNSATGVKFVELPSPPTDDKERWVFFINRRGMLSCADHSVKNFSNEGVQQVILGYDCMESRGELAEAVMSILGVPAQHNAPDRDQYITVNMDNIIPDKKHLFDKLNDNEWLFHDLEYDYNSITHYDMFKYSANGRATIQMKNDEKDFIPAKTMSSDDMLKIKMLYSFITRSAQMHEPTCDKLFKPRNNNEQFTASKVNKKFREKPARYLSNKNSGRMSLKKSEAFRERYLQQLIENADKSKRKTKETETEEHYIKVDETVEESKEKNKRTIKNTDAMTLLSDYHSD